MSSLETALLLTVCFSWWWWRDWHWQISPSGQCTCVC